MKTPEEFIKTIWFKEPKDKYITKDVVFEAMQEYANYVKEITWKQSKNKTFSK